MKSVLTGPASDSGFPLMYDHNTKPFYQKWTSVSHCVYLQEVHEICPWEKFHHKVFFTVPNVEKNLGNCFFYFGLLFYATGKAL